MKKKTTKKENKQIVEIHVYVHQNGFSTPRLGLGGIQCTCGKGISAICPIHTLGGTITLSKNEI